MYIHKFVIVAVTNEDQLRKVTTVAGVLSMMTASLSFQWIWVKEHRNYRYLYKSFNLTIPLKLMNTSHCLWSVFVSCDGRRSDACCQLRHQQDWTCHWYSSTRTASVSFRWIWVKDLFWSGTTWLLGHHVYLPGIFRLDWSSGTCCTTRRL